MAGYLAPEPIFENMLQLIHFGVYFENIMANFIYK